MTWRTPCPHPHIRIAAIGLRQDSPVQRRMRPLGIVQPSAKPPIGPAPAGCFIAGILGAAALSGSAAS